MCQGRRYCVLQRREKGSGQARIESSNDKSDEPIIPYGNTGKGYPAFAVANTLQCETERGFDDPVKETYGQKANDEYEVIVIFQRTHINAEDAGYFKGSPRYPHQTIITAGHGVPLPSKRVDHHAKTECEHGKIDTGMSDAEESQDQCGYPSEKHTADDTRQQGWDHDKDLSTTVCPTCVEARLAKGEKARIPQKEVESQGKYGKD